jgi:BirA family transcriptional regulator, biotin operon repressor / biotin---[acetyl-CoA-carboxylase] ligase
VNAAPSAGTGGSAFGSPRRHYGVTDSTNERARDLAAAGAPSGTVVTAAEQTAGRGRHGRRWSASAGKALLCSAILAPLDERHRLLPLAVPLAVCDAVESLASHECRVKWPNDVWIAERKVAGVLIEARPPQWAVIGIGLNVAIVEDEFPDDLSWPATSVGQGATVAAALAAVCAALGRWVEAPAGEVLDAFRTRDALRGREVSWERAGGEAPSGSGIAEGIDADGNLLVRTEAGEVHALGAGEVHLQLG